VGKKDALGWLALTLLLAPITANAQTVDDLYSLYSIEKTVDADEDVIATIRNYNDIKKFVAMYNYIDLSAPDTSSQDIKIAELEKRIEEIDTELLAGYGMSLSAILDLEAEQKAARESIDRIKNTRKYTHIDIDFPDATKAPTYDEFLKAKQELSEFELSKELGDVTSVAVPVPDGTISQHTKACTSFKVTEPTYVSCVFPGEVIFAKDGILEIQSIGNVVISYSNLNSYNLEVGDTVKQYQRIATVIDNLQVSMQIDGEYYDMWRLFD